MRFIRRPIDLGRHTTVRAREMIDAKFIATIIASKSSPTNWFEAVMEAIKLGAAERSVSRSLIDASVKKNRR